MACIDLALYLHVDRKHSCHCIMVHCNGKLIEKINSTLSNIMKMVNLHWRLFQASAEISYTSDQTDKGYRLGLNRSKKINQFNRDDWKQIINQQSPLSGMFHWFFSNSYKNSLTIDIKIFLITKRFNLITKHNNLFSSPFFNRSYYNKHFTWIHSNGFIILLLHSTNT